MLFCCKFDLQIVIMFHHHGQKRTFIHNLRLATLLSFVAGIVNVTGVLALKTLTTNVTGHFAFFAEEVLKKEYTAAITFLIFTVSFLTGAFVSNFLVELVSKTHPLFSHVLPILLEILVLVCVALFGLQVKISSIDANIMLNALLFAMGIQNSLVTKISQSTVRTTHLTGLFTDLGIELSQLFFYKKPEEVKRLKTNIYLRFSIITFFFLGCFLGGFGYYYFKIKTLFIAAFFLLMALLYNSIRSQFFAIKRRTFHH